MFLAILPYPMMMKTSDETLRQILRIVLKGLGWLLIN
jgi:hypothetical protein